MLLLFPTPSFPANFTPSKPLCLPHRRLFLLRCKAADFDSFTDRSGYLFDLTASEADSLTEYGVSKIAAVYRRKPLILFRRLYQIGTTFGKWFALRYLDRVYDRSDLMFQIRAAELRKILVELGPWLWRSGMERAALWRQVIVVKYGCGWGGWCTRPINGTYGVGLWKNISRGWSSFSRHILYDIGDGSRVKFWGVHALELEALANFMDTIYGALVFEWIELTVYRLKHVCLRHISKLLRLSLLDLYIVVVYGIWFVWSSMDYAVECYGYASFLARVNLTKCEMVLLGSAKGARAQAMGMCKIGGSSMAWYGNYQAIACSDNLCWYAGSIERLQDNKQLCPSGSSQIVTDLIPPSYLDELSLLQDRISPFSTEVAFNTIEQELGLPIDEIFSEISPEPIAAASLGQVYQARLRHSGEVVAVKVQRPGIQAAISLDMLILRFLAGLLRRAGKLNTDLQAVVDEWASSLFREMDYIKEANNGLRFRQLYGGLPDVLVPKMFVEHSTRKVLVMEWVEGEKLSEVKDLYLVEVGVYCSFNQLLEYGFYHADPHPGNLLRTYDGKLAYLVNQFVMYKQYEEQVDHLMLHCCEGEYHMVFTVKLVMPNAMRGVLQPIHIASLFGLFAEYSLDVSVYVTIYFCLQYVKFILNLDFGMMGEFKQELRDGFIEACLHLVNRDFDALAKDFVTLGLLPPTADKEAVTKALTGVFQDAVAKGVRNISFGDLLGNLGTTMYKFKFQIPSYFSLVIRSLAVLEGIAISSNPDYKVLGSTYPWIARKVLTDSSPQLKSSLQNLLYEEGVFRIDRLESLLMESLRARTEKALVRKPVEETNSRVVVKQVLSFTLTEKGAFVRDILLQEIAKGLDALGIATLDSIPFISFFSFSSMTDEDKVNLRTLRRLMLLVSGHQSTENTDTDEELKGALFDLMSSLPFHFSPFLCDLLFLFSYRLAKILSFLMPYFSHKFPFILPAYASISLSKFSLLDSHHPSARQPLTHFDCKGLGGVSPYKSQNVYQEEASLVFNQLASVQEILPILSVISELPPESQQQLFSLPADLAGRLISRVTARTIRRMFL
uniref:ABC1 atypical kinase-like domain-containing protein n=1 Tax=Quercus lobata TaxID=97700 RepID=A0A7N2KVG7_QUELO